MSSKISREEYTRFFVATVFGFILFAGFCTVSIIEDGARDVGISELEENLTELKSLLITSHKYVLKEISDVEGQNNLLDGFKVECVKWQNQTHAIYGGVFNLTVMYVQYDADEWQDNFSVRGDWVLMGSRTERLCLRETLSRDISYDYYFNPLFFDTPDEPFAYIPLAGGLKMTKKANQKALDDFK